MTEKEKIKFIEWLNENGGKQGVLYQTFSDDELERIFLSAYEKNKESETRRVLCLKEI